MTKKLRKCDYIFVFSMIVVLTMHLLCIFSPDHFADESFYPTIPLRLINGDSLVGDEWHLTQFSSLFLYLPVRFWLLIKGSTEGIILYLRFFYFTIHTGVSIWLYKHFRAHAIPAVVSTLLFYSQVPLRFMSANYHSLLALFLLLFTISLHTIATKEKKVIYYLLAGCCYACCCVCNPFECFIYPIYLFICILWEIKNKHTNKGRRIPYKELMKAKEKYDLQRKFFGKDAILGFSTGIALTAAICVIFFVLTGGSFSSLKENIPHLLTDGGHDIFLSPLKSFIEKISLTAKHINSISLGLPFILPAFFITLFIDKKRKKAVHMLVYIIIAFVLAVFFTVGVTLGALNSSRCLAITLPLAIVSTTCYILTQNKNKQLFYCMWLPSAVATVIQYLASDLHLSVMWTLVIGNLAGVFFISDFINELRHLPTEKNNQSQEKTATLCTRLLCAGVCLQLILQCGLYVIGRTVGSDYVKLDKGPYSGIYMNQDTYNKNHSIMSDLNQIKSLADNDEPVLIISEFSWMYLYIERPFATYSAWQPFLEADRLKAYYSLNPCKIPSYIFIGYNTIPSSVLKGYGYNTKRAQSYAETLKRMFKCEEEALSNGILLTIKDKTLLT